MHGFLLIRPFSGQPEPDGPSLALCTATCAALQAQLLRREAEAVTTDTLPRRATAPEVFSLLVTRTQKAPVSRRFQKLPD
jgi:hypothetical protein